MSQGIANQPTPQQGSAASVLPALELLVVGGVLVVAGDDYQGLSEPPHCLPLPRRRGFLRTITDQVAARQTCCGAIWLGMQLRVHGLR